MGHLKIGFLATSVAFLVVVAVATIHVVSAREAWNIVEITVEGYGADVVDRCPTCHHVPAGAEFPQGHPEVPGYHPVERFGCSLCHGGEPRAVEKVWAHTRGREPLLHLSTRDESKRLERVEAGCARCHVEIGSTGLVYDATLVPHVAAGHELFVKRACWGCHRVADLSLGERGPDLSDVGARLNGDEIHVSIQDPSAAPSSTTMPNLRLPQDELRALVSFLMSQIDPDRTAAVATARMLAERPPGTPPRRPDVDEGMAQGGDLMLNLGCVGCHRLQSRDGQVGPDLRWEGFLRGPRYVRDMIERPSSTVVGSRMPPVDLRETEIEATSQFLSRQWEIAPSDIDAVWNDICARCHGLDGHGRTAVAPYLARRPRDLSSRDFFRGVEPNRLVRSLRDGVAGTPMAPWGEAIPVIGGKRVISFLSKKLHNGMLPSPRRVKTPRRPSELSKATLSQADQLFEVECSSCHGPTGRGDGPEALGLQPRPRDLNNGAYISSLRERRLFLSIGYGPVGSAMPGHLWGYDSDVIWALTDRVREIAGEPLTGEYADDHWPWQRRTKKAGSRRRGAKGRQKFPRVPGKSPRPRAKAPAPALKMPPIKALQSPAKVLPSKASR